LERGGTTNINKQGDPHMKRLRSFWTLASAVAIGMLSQTVGAVQNQDLAFDTTAELDHVCSVGPEDPNFVAASLACRAFIEATVQYHDEVTNRKNLKRLICYPKGATVEDGRVAFVSWAARHGNDKKLMGEVPVVGVVRALAAKYPCKR
jgi:hypothetical protein